MDHFWTNLFDYVKERRNAMFFFGTLMFFFLFILVGALACQLSEAINLAENWPLLLPGIFLILIAFIWRGIRQRRLERLNRYKTSPLSRDELAKARSKLTTRQTFKKS